MYFLILKVTSYFMISINTCLQQWQAHQCLHCNEDQQEKSSFSWHDHLKSDPLDKPNVGNKVQHPVGKSQTQAIQVVFDDHF